MRPSRLSDPALGFVEALRKKYASDLPADARPGAKWAYTHVSSPVWISGKEVEEVGFNKIRQQLADLHELRIVILDGLRVCRPEARFLRRPVLSKQETLQKLEDITRTCPNITELDLSKNLFEEWSEVEDIGRQLQQLNSLKLDGNRFLSLQIKDVSTFHAVTSLSLAGTLLSWDSTASLLPSFPSLESLVVSANILSCLSEHLLPSTLTSLTLEDNKFTSLANLAPLRQLPYLRSLGLRFNQIASIFSVSSSDFESPLFPSSLTTLDLSYNAIADFTFIDSLHIHVPGMKSLQASHNPLYDRLKAPDGRSLTAEDGYMLTVARLPNLKELNHSKITDRERLNAEIYYWSLICSELAAVPEGQETAVKRGHRRFEELERAYGDRGRVSRQLDGQRNPNSLAARLITITFALGNSQVTRETPKDFSIYSVLGLAARSFGIMQPWRLKLTWETGEWDEAKRGEAVYEDYSDSDDEIVGVESGGRSKKVPRDVELKAGTRTIGSWIDGDEARIRLEIPDSRP